MKSLLFALFFFAALAHAHKPSDSYLSLEAGGAANLRGQWDIALRDLEHAIGLDRDGNGEITWGELKAKRSEVEAYALARLGIAAGGKPCELAPAGFLVDEHTDGAYAVLQFSIACPQPGGIEISYTLFADLDPTHRGLLRAKLGGGTVTAVLGPDQSRLQLKGGRSGWAQFADYAKEGVWHIWIGFDHVLFLLALLLPSVIAATRFRSVFWEVAKVVTAFTVAHSLTLALAAYPLSFSRMNVLRSSCSSTIDASRMNWDETKKIQQVGLRVEEFNRPEDFTSREVS